MNERWLVGERPNVVRYLLVGPVSESAMCFMLNVGRCSLSLFTLHTPGKYRETNLEALICFNLWVGLFSLSFPTVVLHDGPQLAVFEVYIEI